MQDSQKLKERMKEHVDVLLQDFFEDLDLLRILPGVGLQVGICFFFLHRFTLYLQYLIFDPWIRDRKKSGPGIRDKRPGLFFREIINSF
jgi:hypothetical protein